MMRLMRLVLADVRRIKLGWLNSAHKEARQQLLQIGNEFMCVVATLTTTETARDPRFEHRKGDSTT